MLESKQQALRVIESKKRELEKLIESRDKRLADFGYESSLQNHQRVEETRQNLHGMEELFLFVFDK